jgi:hypothetical protein
MEGPLKWFSILPGTPTYEKVYRYEKVDSGEYNSITAKLLPRKFICISKYQHFYVDYLFRDFLRNAQPRRVHGWEPPLYSTDYGYQFSYAVGT